MVQTRSPSTALVGDEHTPVFTCFTALKESSLIALVGYENPDCLLPVLYALYTTNWTEKYVSFARCGRSCAPSRSFMYSYILDRNTEGVCLPSHYPYQPIIHLFLGHVDFQEQYHSIQSHTSIPFHHHHQRHSSSSRWTFLPQSPHPHSPRSVPSDPPLSFPSDFRPLGHSHFPRLYAP